MGSEIKLSIENNDESLQESPIIGLGDSPGEKTSSKCNWVILNLTEDGSPNTKSSSHKKSRGGHGSHNKESKEEKREKLKKLLLEKLEIEDIREVRLKSVNQFDSKFNHTSAADSHNAYTDMSTSPSKEAR